MKKIMVSALVLLLMFTFGISAYADSKSGVEHLDEEFKFIYVNVQGSEVGSKEYNEAIKALNESLKKEKKNKGDFSIMVPEDPFGYGWTIVERVDDTFVEHTSQQVEYIVVGAFSVMAYVFTEAATNSKGWGAAVAAISAYASSVFADSFEPRYTSTTIVEYWSDYYDDYIYRAVEYEYQTKYRNSDEVISVEMSGVIGVGREFMYGSN